MAAPKGQPDAPQAALGSRAEAPSEATARSGLSLAERFAWIIERPSVVLAAGVGVAMVFNLWATRGQIFFEDEWSRFLYDSSSVEFYLRGFTGHLVLLHTLLYKALFTAFGAGYLSFRIVEALLLGACGVLFYLFARSRAAPWPCAAATLVLLFLGSSFEVTATPYGIVILLPVAIGLAGLVCLDRFRARADPVTCLVLVAAVAAHSDGLVFVVGAAAMLILQSGRRWWARAWVVGVPVLLYAAWWAWYQLSQTHPAEVAHITNVRDIPSTVAAASAAGFSAISGLFGTSGFSGVPFNTEAGYVVLGLVIVAAVWRHRSGLPIAREIWVPIAMGLTFWALLGTAASYQRLPTTSRYLYPSAIFLLLIVLELTRGVRPTPRLAWAAIAAVVVALVPNVINLNQQAREIRALAATERANLAALELLRREVPSTSLPELVRTRVLTVGNAVIVGEGYRFAGHRGYRFAPARYFASVRRFGSPAPGPQWIVSRSEAVRQEADAVLLRGRDLTLSDLPNDSAAGRACRPVGGQAGGDGRTFTVPAGGLELQPRDSRAGMNVAARRFATGFKPLEIPAGAGPLFLKPGRTSELRPWIVRVEGAAVCAARPGPGAQSPGAS